MLGIRTISNATREVLIAELEDIVFEGDYPREIAKEIMTVMTSLIDCEKIIIRNEVSSDNPFSA